jgi:hypothetical protein
MKNTLPKKLKKAKGKEFSFEGKNFDSIGLTQKYLKDLKTLFPNSKIRREEEKRIFKTIQLLNGAVCFGLVLI